MAEPPRKRVSLPVVGQPKRAPLTALEDVDLGSDLPQKRSPAAWAILGALSTFAVFIPMMLLLTPVVGFITRSGGSMAAGAALTAVAICASGYAGGYVVGRFGTTPRDSGIGGAMAGLVLWGLAIAGGLRGSYAWLGVVLPVLTVPFAWLGGRRGLKDRRPGDTISA